MLGTQDSLQRENVELVKTNKKGKKKITPKEKLNLFSIDFFVVKASISPNHNETAFV